MNDNDECKMWIDDILSVYNIVEDNLESFEDFIDDPEEQHRLWDNEDDSIEESNDTDDISEDDNQCGDTMDDVETEEYINYTYEVDHQSDDMNEVEEQHRQWAIQFSQEEHNSWVDDISYEEENQTYIDDEVEAQHEAWANEDMYDDDDQQNQYYQQLRPEQRIQSLLDIDFSHLQAEVLEGNEENDGEVENEQWSSEFQEEESNVQQWQNSEQNAEEYEPEFVEEATTEQWVPGFQYEGYTEQYEPGFVGDGSIEQWESVLQEDAIAEQYEPEFVHEEIDEQWEVGLVDEEYREEYEPGYEHNENTEQWENTCEQEECVIQQWVPSYEVESTEQWKAAYQETNIHQWWPEVEENTEQLDNDCTEQYGQYEQATKPVFTPQNEWFENCEPDAAENTEQLDNGVENDTEQYGHYEQFDAAKPVFPPQNEWVENFQPQSTTPWVPSKPRHRRLIGRYCNLGVDVHPMLEECVDVDVALNEHNAKGLEWQLPRDENENSNEFDQIQEPQKPQVYAGSRQKRPSHWPPLPQDHVLRILNKKRQKPSQRWDTIL